MNILYIADPGSIHDIRWVRYFASKEDARCFVVARRHHRKETGTAIFLRNPEVLLVGTIDDPSVVRPWQNWIQSYKIRRLVAKYRIDVIHVLYAEPNALWASWKRMFGVPVMVTTRGTDILRTIPEFFKSDGFIKKRVARNYLRAFMQADHITCTSGHQVKSLTALGVPSSRISLVRTGVDVKALVNSVSDLAGLPDIGKPFVLMPRNMSPAYNHEFTLDAIALLVPELRKRYAYVFVNADTTEKEYFSKIRTKASEVDADIVFLPSLPHEHLIALVRRASLVVMNPLSDGSPVTAMEAMAYRVPLILPPLPYDKVIFENVCTFDEWKASVLAGKITELLLAPADYLTSIVERNFARVNDYGNTDKELSRVWELYVRLRTKQEIR